MERPFTSGFPISEFARRGIGPAARCDHVDYRRELRHLEEVAVEPWLAGLSEDGSRFRFRNVLRKAGGEEAAPVTTEAGWLDLTERRLTLTGGRNPVIHAVEPDWIPKHVRADLGSPDVGGGLGGAAALLKRRRLRSSTCQSTCQGDGGTLLAARR